MATNMNNTSLTDLVWTWSDTDLSDLHNILQLVPACLGIIGNLLVIIVLIPRRSSNRSTDRLIGHLAIADLLTSVFLMPYPDAIINPRNWLGVLYCGLIETATTRLVCVTASVYILLAICIDRFLAVVYPLQFNRWVTRGRVSFAVACIWIGSSVGQYVTNFVRYDISPEGKCSRNYLIPLSGNIISGSLNFFFLFPIPACTMLITQIIIARTLHRQSAQFAPDRNLPQFKTSFHMVARKKVLKMMAIVVVIFVVCVGPNQVSYYLFNVGVLDHEYLSNDIHRATFILTFYNSCANPFIYAAQNKNFRQALIDIWRRSQSPNSHIF